MRSRNQLRLEIEKSVRRFAVREHPGREGARLDLRRVQRTFLLLLRKRIRIRRLARQFGTLHRCVQVNHVARRSRFQVAIARVDQFRAQVEPQRFARVVFHNHQHRNHAVLRRIHLAERLPGLFLRHVRNRRKRDLIERLMIRIRSRRPRLEGRFVVVPGARRYTRKNGYREHE